MRRGICAFAALLHQEKPSLSKMKLINNFKEWKFKDPPNYAELPIDENPEYNIPMAVKDAVFSKVPVEPLTGTLHLVCASEDAMKDILDLDPAVAEMEEFINFVAGRYLPPGGLTVSHRYGGYQFGFWADQLGDGRAHVLGEYVNSKGESWQPQLKGSGETPYSRFGDGRAVLRSSIREMVASEACHHLGIPTTRAAALVVSDEHQVYRDKSYSGHARPERCAAVLRLAPAWYRGGSLEILHKRKEPHTCRTLLDFMIKHHFPEISLTDDDRYVKWFSEVCHKNLDMVATWQGAGFVHGVLNTDNVSVLGLSIDYGPYGFIDHYRRQYVPNTSDDMGRYAYCKQPQIIIWNMGKLAEALAPVLSEQQQQQAAAVLATLEENVDKKVLQTFLRKLGLLELQAGDQQLVDSLLLLMESSMADFTATFRQLAEIDRADLQNKSVLESKWSLAKLSAGKGWEAWADAYLHRLEQENVSEESRQERMRGVNPVYVPRNWMLQEAIADAEKNDFEKVRFLLQVLRHPFQVSEEAERRGYSAQPPSWAYGLKLSCSS